MALTPGVTRFQISEIGQKLKSLRKHVPPSAGHSFRVTEGVPQGQRSLLEGARPRLKQLFGSHQMLTMLPGPLRYQQAGGSPHASRVWVCEKRRPLSVLGAPSETWPPLPGVCGREGVELSETHVLQDALPTVGGLEGQDVLCVASGFAFLPEREDLVC